MRLVSNPQHLKGGCAARVEHHHKLLGAAGTVVESAPKRRFHVCQYGLRRSGRTRRILFERGPQMHHQDWVPITVILCPVYLPDNHQTLAQMQMCPSLFACVDEGLKPKHLVAIVG